jgi:formate dehydrogenase maturation protein FdhE
MTEKKLCPKCGSEHIETSIEWISDTEWKVVGTICVECGHEEKVK